MKAYMRVSAHTKNLASIRLWLADSATTANVLPDEVDDMVLAVDEAVANIIVHGHHNQGGEIEIEMEIDDSALCVRLRDRAPPFDPTRVPPRDIEQPLAERPLGGMGVHLIRQLTDEMIYRYTPQGGNELTLLRRRVGPRHTHKQGDKMEIRTQPGKVTIVTVKGYIDADTFSEFSKRVQALLDQGAVNLAIDLGDVTYISSAGMVAAQTIAGHAASKGGKVVFFNLSRQVAQVFKLTGLDKKLTIVTDLAQAQARL